MIGELFKQIFRFNKLGTLDWSAIVLVAVSVILVTLILFLIRYCINYGLFRVLGMSVLCGLIWALNASAVVTAFDDQGNLYTLVIVALSLLWLLFVIIIVLKRPQFKGMTRCVILALVFFAITILVCIPVQAFKEQLANFANTYLG